MQCESKKIPPMFSDIFTVRRSALHGLWDRNSVRLSVCPSDTLVDCVHMVRPTIMISSPYGSTIILVSVDIMLIPKFEGVTLSEGIEYEGGVGTNWRFSTNKPPYLRNGVRYDKGYYRSLTGNRIHAFDWYQNQRPWLTLK